MARDVGFAHIAYAMARVRCLRLNPRSYSLFDFSFVGRYDTVIT